MSQNARVDEEQATQRRARILGIDYVDTTQLPEKRSTVSYYNSGD